MDQPTFFTAVAAEIDNEQVVLYALGDFQSRKKELADRELALDRLRGAFKRAAEKFQIDELSDETIAGILENLGAKVKKVPTFVAKHPFRVTVTAEIAIRGREVFGIKGK